MGVLKTWKRLRPSQNHLPNTNDQVRSSSHAHSPLIDKSRPGFISGDFSPKQTVLSQYHHPSPVPELSHHSFLPKTSSSLPNKILLRVTEFLIPSYPTFLDNKGYTIHHMRDSLTYPSLQPVESLPVASLTLNELTRITNEDTSRQPSLKVY